MKRLLFVFSALIAGFGIGFLIPVTHAQTSTLWFTVTSGQTTCKVSKISQTPIRISYNCSNPFGATAGSYTADPVGGVLNFNNVLIGLNAPTADNVFCIITMNGTAQQITNNNANPPLTVAANSAAYMCGASSVSGPGSISWP
jgi:hypothetical protein